MKDLQFYYSLLCATPMPHLGKLIGDFALYDSLLAGWAGRAMRGEIVGAGDLPDLDDETRMLAEHVRQTATPTFEELEFVKYLDLTDAVRRCLLDTLSTSGKDS